MAEVPDDYKHPKCYANTRGGCSSKISGEHYVSHGLIKASFSSLPSANSRLRRAFCSRSSLSSGAFGHHMSMSSGVPVQFFQSIIAAQLAVAGALLFQVRFFDTSNGKSGSQVDPRLRLVLVLVIAATLFVSLEAMREGWGSAAAALVAGGLAVSVLPILLRVLPPLTRDIETQNRDPHLWITVLAVILYFAIVTIVVLIR